MTDHATESVASQRKSSATVAWTKDGYKHRGILVIPVWDEEVWMCEHNHATRDQALSCARKQLALMYGPET